MSRKSFVRRVWLNVPAGEVFAWHARPGAFERLQPPWERVEVVDRTRGIKDGAQVALLVRVGPFRKRWTLVHRDYVADRQFCDEQLEGPFRFWRHTHRTVPEGERRCYLEDKIEYELPLGPAGELLGGRFFRRKLNRTFDHRHRIMVQDLKVHGQNKTRGPMRVLVSGASGLVGSALTAFLTTGGHTVLRLVRSKTADGISEIYWNPSGVVDTSNLDGLDAVVHLAGENLAEGQWTDEKKQRIRESRVGGTRLLSETLACLPRPPKALVCASAVGYYGDRGDEALTEDSGPGSGFLAEVCREWELASEVASKNGIRVVNLRLGMVLTPAGGALAKMLPPFRFGLGGRLSSGNQYMSWISLEDVVGAIYHAVVTENLSGAVNGVAPHPVTNAEFTTTLGRVLRRPTVFSVPVSALRRTFGEMADALLLASTRAEPAALAASGYRFRHRELEIALRQTLGK